MRTTLAVVVGIALLLPGTAAASPPTNDNFTNATVIDPGSLPYADSVDASSATAEALEASCTSPPEGKSVWYSYTPTANQVVRADTHGSTFSDTTLSAWSGPGLGSLSNVGGCQYFFESELLIHLQAGTTYHFRAAVFPFGSGGGELHFHLQEIPPPANDHFVAAQDISMLPFSSTTVDATGATIETGEPTPSCVGSLQSGTVWYSFSPTETGSISASAAYYNTMAVYTGGGLGSLTQLDCRNFGQLVTFRAEAGTTYYFQLAGLYGNMSLQLQLVKTPPPNPAIGYYPSDPSSFDTIQFLDQSNDPGQVGFSSTSWEFGDGGSSANPGCCPTHRYLADGEYTVKLTVATTDGRSASTTRVVQVRTHDVAVAKMSVPQSASTGQTRSIVVGLSNKRYAEMVRIDLYRSGAGGFVQFASSTQSVPVRGGNKTSDFAFNYTFTSDDALLGKVTFKAVATIVTARDALPTDNEAISLPTKVNK
jgi:PKD repeat protein